MKAVYGHVPVLDTGARGSTVTFAQRGVGDVLLSWENEAHLSLAEFGEDKFDIVYPPVSILAEPPVAVVDKNVAKHGTAVVALGYLNFLYSPLGQDIIGRTSTARATLRRQPGTPAISPSCRCSTSTTPSAAGARPRPSTSAMAACSTASTRRTADAIQLPLPCHPGRSPQGGDPGSGQGAGVCGDPR